MKTILIGLMLAPLLSFSALAAGEKQEYKCYVKSSDGEKIVFYNWQVSEFERRATELPGRQNVNKAGKKYFIKDVHECVTVKGEFSLGRAQKLDKDTVR